MRKEMTVALSAALIAVASPALPQALTGGEDYTALDLLSPCQEADNDARWGAAAEAECEQYIIGYVDALRVTGGTGPDSGVCPPDVNTADEIRWAFMRWVHEDYSDRGEMAAKDALMSALRDSFPCEG